MELLEEITHPKPLEELLTAAYETYRGGHPWVADHELRPKSVVREMWERAMTFSELIGDYQLARSEGLVLRYLSDVYKTLGRTVPDGGPQRASSRTSPSGSASSCARPTPACSTSGSSSSSPASTRSTCGRKAMGAETPRPVTGNARAFRVLVRNAMFRRVELAAFGRWTELGELDGEDGWDAEAWMEAMAAYREEYGVRVRRTSAPGRARADPSCSWSRRAPRRGPSARRSTIRRATATGASARRSTWPRATRSAKPPSPSSTSVRAR